MSDDPNEAGIIPRSIEGIFNRIRFEADAKSEFLVQVPADPMCIFLVICVSAFAPFWKFCLETTGYTFQRRCRMWKSIWSGYAIYWTRKSITWRFVHTEKKLRVGMHSHILGIPFPSLQLNFFPISVVGHIRFASTPRVESTSKT